MKTKTKITPKAAAASKAGSKQASQPRALAQKRPFQPLSQAPATKTPGTSKTAKNGLPVVKNAGMAEQVQAAVATQGAAGMREALELLTGAGGAAMPDLLPVSLLAVDQACSLLHSEAFETWNALVDEGRDPARVTEWTRAVLAGALGRMEAAVANTQKALARLAEAQEPR